MGDFFQPPHKFSDEQQHYPLQVFKDQKKAFSKDFIAFQKEGFQYASSSTSQWRMWFLNQLNPTHYTIVIPLTLKGDLFFMALFQTIKELLRRHEILRTNFVMVEEHLLQVIVPTIPCPLHFIDLHTLAKSVRSKELLLRSQEEACRTFDLTHDPLLHATVLKVSNEEHLLFLVAHHIIIDGWSIRILIHEFSTLYDAFAKRERSPLPELPIQYTHFVQWQHQQFQNGELERLLEYWRLHLAGAPSLIELPTDHPRPQIETFKGATQSLLLSKELSTALKTFSQRQRSTLFMTVLAVLKMLLFKWTRQTDLVIGTVLAGRSRPETKDLIGCFINFLALRSHIDEDQTGLEFLHQVRSTVINAYKYQECPFEKVVEVTRPERKANRNPLYNVALLLQMYANSALTNQSERIALTRSLTTERQLADLDLQFKVYDTSDGILLTCEYNPDLFETATIESVNASYCRILEQFMHDPSAKIRSYSLLQDLEVQMMKTQATISLGDRISASGRFRTTSSLLTLPERHQMIETWNMTQQPYSRDVCLHQLFEMQVQAASDAIALRYEEVQITYAYLNLQANHLAYMLRKHGVGPEQLVGLGLERCPQAVIGILAILKAGGGYVPLDPAYPDERLAYMLNDARICILLTTTQYQECFPISGIEVIRLDIVFETLMLEPDTNPSNLTDPQNVAYLIYTSGSTGQPKGVIGCHQACVNRFSWMWNAFPFHLQDVCCQKTALSFVDSVWETLGPLLQGVPLLILSHDSVQDLHLLVENMNLHSVSRLLLVPSLLQALLNTVPDLHNHLPHLYLWITSGETVSVEMTKQFYALLPQKHLLNLYGSSEIAADATYYSVTPQDAFSNTVPIGHPITNTQVYVLDTRLQPVPVGAIGDLYVGGDNLARGYFYQPDLTAECFIPHPFTHQSGARLYRTGDIARFLPDGCLQFIGRLDQQIKIRGFRIELGEIDTVLEQHPAIQAALTQLWEKDPSDKRLVAYITLRDKPPPTGETLHHYLRDRLPSSMLPSAFVVLETFPLLPNGKVDRHALPDPHHVKLFGGNEYVPPRMPLEEIVADVWGKVLRRERIGIYDDFFALGGHSLLAIQMISRLRQVLQVDLPLRILFEAPTIVGFARYITSILQGKQQEITIPRAFTTRPASLPLSFAQQRLWFLEQLEPGTSAYHITLATRLAGPLLVAALQHSIQQIVARHEGLRTCFVEHQGEPLQVILPTLALPLPVIDLRGLPDEQRQVALSALGAQEAPLLFDLAHGPLLRTTLLRLGEHEHVLLVSMHHLISDGWSIGVFFHELLVLYDAFSQNRTSPLPPLPIQYADYALWQRDGQPDTGQDPHLAYWHQQLAQAPQLFLPTDHPRPSRQTFRGASQTLVLSSELTQALKATCQREGVTLFMFLLAAFQLLLHRYSAQEDIVVGTPIAGRTHADFEGLIGFFANTLVIRTAVSGPVTVRELVRRVREVCLQAYTHQDVPFEKIVDVLQIERDLSRSPLFQVMFQLQNAAFSPSAGAPQPTLQVSSLDVASTTTKFDLTLALAETAQGIRGRFEYNTDLFEAATIQRMIGHWCRIVASMVDDLTCPVKDLPLLSPEEQEQIVGQWNTTHDPFPQEICVHQVFERQVAATPDRVAVVYEDAHLTSAALNHLANRLAWQLHELGVRPEILVGISLERSLELVIGVLGILKAGGAYVPLDPSLPQERLLFQLHDAQVALLLTQQHLLATWDHSSWEKPILCVEVELQRIQTGPQTLAVSSGVVAANSAYVMYTSGSTGRPKGIVVAHQQVVNVLLFMQKTLDVTEQDVLLAVTTLSFDIATLELFLPLMASARLSLASHQSVRDGQRLAAQVATATLMQATPATWQLLLEAGWQGHDQLKILCGGEALSRTLAQDLLRRAAGVWNVYGPTETTIWSTLERLAEEEGPVVIGRPVANTQIYLLDGFGSPTPIGVPGEVYIAGAGVARGYLGRADLTAERFLSDPFSSQPGARLYRTGDLARYRKDGRIEYLGRLDTQVKVRGYRIELEEIEAVLARHPMVARSVVLLQEALSGGSQIVAYIEQKQERVVSSRELQTFSQKMLPGYMIPSLFITLPQIPLTPNGKIDRNALQRLCVDTPQGEKLFVPPQNAVEQTLANIWCRVLHLDRVSIYDNFFELGGDSLLSIRVISQAHQEGLQITPGDIIQNQTIFEQASNILEISS